MPQAPRCLCTSDPERTTGRSPLAYSASEIFLMLSSLIMAIWKGFTAAFVFFSDGFSSVS